MFAKNRDIDIPQRVLQLSKKNAMRMVYIHVNLEERNIAEVGRRHLDHVGTVLSQRSANCWTGYNSAELKDSDS